MSDVQSDCRPREKSEPMVLKPWLKRIEVSKCVSATVTSHHFREFQTKWAIRILRDWWRCQLTRGTHSHRGNYRENPVPEFVYEALAWVLRRDVHDWRSSGVRWKLNQMYPELERRNVDSCVKVKGLVHVESFST